MSQIDNFYKVDLLHNGDFKTAPNGDYALAKGIVNLKQALFNRLLTVKGSIVHRPDYGVGIKTFQGALSRISEQRKLANLIKEQFEQDERVDKLESIAVSKQDTDGTFMITYKVSVSGGGLIEETVSPFGEVTI